MQLLVETLAREAGGVVGVLGGTDGGYWGVQGVVGVLPGVQERGNQNQAPAPLILSLRPTRPTNGCLIELQPHSILSCFCFL